MTAIRLPFGYPFAMPRHEDVVRRIATDSGIPFVSMVGTSTAKVAGTPRSDWFADTIHGTARGHELRARVATERLHDELR